MTHETGLTNIITCPLLTWAHISACFSSSHSCWWPMMEPGLQILSQAMVSMAVHLQCFIM